MTTQRLGSRMLTAAFTAGLAAACQPDDRAEPRPVPADHEVEPTLPSDPAPPSFSSCPIGFHATGDMRFGTQACELDVLPAEPGAKGCPSGWTLEDIDYGIYGSSPLKRPVLACKPLIPSSRCMDNQRVDLASGACVTVGTACPASGAWPAQPPAGPTVIFVRAGASGTGTQASPLGTLGAAIAKAKAGDTIVLAAGTYKGAFVIDRPLSIVGTCPAQVMIEGIVSTKVVSEDDPTSIEGTFDVATGGALTLRDVTVRGARHGLHLLPESSATVAGVRFDQNTDRAIMVQGGTLTLSDAVVERTLPRVDGTKGRGLQVNMAGKAEATNVTFQDNDRGEVLAFQAGSAATLTDCLLQNTRDEGDGAGIVAGEAGQVRASNIVVQRKRGYGIHASGTGQVSLTQAYVGRIAADPFGNGLGAEVISGGGLQAEDSLWHELVGFGIKAEDEGTTLSLSRSTVSYVQLNARENAFGRAVSVLDGAHATLSTVHLGPNQEAGLKVSAASAVVEDLTTQENGSFGALVELGGELEVSRFWSIADKGMGVVSRKGGTLTLRDARIDDPEEVNGADGPSLGMGLIVMESKATLERVYARHGQGIAVSFRDSTVDATGLVVEDLLSSPGDRANGVGLMVQRGKVALHGVLIRRARMGGIYVGDDVDDPMFAETMLQGSDLVIEDVLGQEKDGSNGMGLILAAGSYATLERVSVSGARAAGVIASEKGESTFADLSVSDTQLGEGTDTVGYGIYAGAGAHLTVKRGRVRNSHGAGVLLNGNGGSLIADDLTIQGTSAIAGEDGVGLRVVGGAAARLRRSAVMDSSAVGVLLQFAGVLDAEDLTLSGVATGALVSEDTFGRDRIENVGNCLFATARSQVSLHGSRMTGCEVVGALFDDSQGELNDVQIDGAQVGLAIQGFPEPTVYWTQVGLTTNDTPLNYRESDFEVPASPPPGLSPESPSASVLRAEE